MVFKMTMYSNWYIMVYTFIQLRAYIYTRMYVCVLSSVRLFVTLWTVACQTPLSMEFSRQEYWSELPFPSPGESSQPSTAGRVFIVWATRVALIKKICSQMSWSLKIKHSIIVRISYEIFNIWGKFIKICLSCFMYIVIYLKNIY